ncbi:DUF1772 domain-containing protein [Kocuria sp. M1R5S2]|uniref:anthrone oxygenase family protein n=1 Tax=Kocuria rhizosphaerae TaxID=3376285 RepID=UPI00378EC983
MTEPGAVEAWLVLAAGIGSGMLGGFYLAFSLVVMPALRDRPAGEAASAMIAINEAAVRAPFMVLFFGTALACLIVVATGWSTPGAPIRVLGALASLTGWVLTMAINVPLNTRLARTERSTVVWHAYARPWIRANHFRAGLSLLGALGLLNPLP